MLQYTIDIVAAIDGNHQYSTFANTVRAYKLANTAAALEHAQKRRKAWHIGANEKAIFSQR